MTVIEYVKIRPNILKVPETLTILLLFADTCKCRFCRKFYLRACVFLNTTLWFACKFVFIIFINDVCFRRLLFTYYHFDVLLLSTLQLWFFILLLLYCLNFFDVFLLFECTIATLPNLLLVLKAIFWLAIYIFSLFWYRTSFVVLKLQQLIVIPSEAILIC